MLCNSSSSCQTTRPEQSEREACDLAAFCGMFACRLLFYLFMLCGSGCLEGVDVTTTVSMRLPLLDRLLVSGVLACWVVGRRFFSSVLRCQPVPVGGGDW